MVDFSNTDNHESSGVIFSTGWPYSYRASYRSCNFEICKSYGYQGTYVVFMDINMYNVHNSQDYVQLYGKQKLFYELCFLIVAAVDPFNLRKCKTA